MQESPLISDEEYSKLEEEFEDSDHAVAEVKPEAVGELQPEEIEYERLKKQ